MLSKVLPPSIGNISGSEMVTTIGLAEEMKIIAGCSIPVRLISPFLGLQTTRWHHCIISQMTSLHHQPDNIITSSARWHHHIMRFSSKEPLMTKFFSWLIVGLLILFTPPCSFWVNWMLSSTSSLLTISCSCVLFDAWVILSYQF